MVKSMRGLLATFAILLSLAASPALAKNVTADLDGIANLLRSKGNKVDIRGAANERYIWVENPDAYTYSIDVMSCDQGTQKNCKSVQFHSGFTAEKPITPDALMGKQEGLHGCHSGCHRRNLRDSRPQDCLFCKLCPGDLVWSTPA